MPTIKQLSKIISEDHSLNRIQDQLASALNPILRAVKGDLSGPLESPTVVGLQGRQVDPSAPTGGDVLTFDGKVWTHSAPEVPVSPPIGKLIFSFSPVQDIPTDATAFLPTTTFHRFTVSGANRSLTATPTINWPDAVVGQVVILNNVNPLGGNWVRLNRGTTTKLQLSNSNKQIDPGGTMTLVYDGTNWVEVTHTQGTRT